MSPLSSRFSILSLLFIWSPFVATELSGQLPDFLASLLSDEALLLKARTQADRGAHQQAVDLFRQAVQRNPGSMPAHVGLASALLKTGRVDEATRACSTGLVQDSTSLPLYNTLSASYATQGRYSLAIRALERALAVESDYLLGLINLGSTYAKLGRYDRAEEALVKGRRLAPLQPEVQRRLGELYLGTGRPEEAIAALAAALEILPGSEVLHYLSGKAFEAEGQSENALEAYLQACRLDPGFADAQYRAATLARRLERTATADSALRAFQRLQAIGRGDRVLLVKMKKLRAAILDSPEEPLHHFRMARFFALHGYEREARNRFARVLQLNPEHFPSLNRMGGFLLRDRKPERALLFFEQTLRLSPDFISARLNAGNANMLLGRPRAAAAHYGRAAELEPQMAMIWYQLARAHLALDEVMTARQAVNKGLGASGTDENTRRSLEALADQIEQRI